VLETIKEKLKALYLKWSTIGVKLPFAYDPTTDKPSITLFFPYASFVVALASVIALHFYPTLLPATTISIIFWVLATVLYMVRKINKAKFDLSDKSIEIEGGDEPTPPSRPSDAA